MNLILLLPLFSPVQIKPDPVGKQEYFAEAFCETKKWTVCHYYMQDVLYSPRGLFFAGVYIILAKLITIVLSSLALSNYKW